MSLGRPWIVLALFAAAAVQAAVIYKWTDAQGVVHYSDQPVPGAEKIVTSGQPAFDKAAPGAAANPAAIGKKPAAPGTNTGVFSITSPVPEQTFFGDQPIGAHLALQPDLKPNQHITWHLSGREVEEGADLTQFTLPHLDRGTYILAATLVNQDTGTAQTTESVTFYVRQPSLLSPEHKRP